MSSLSWRSSSRSVGARDGDREVRSVPSSFVLCNKSIVFDALRSAFLKALDGVVGLGAGALKVLHHLRVEPGGADQAHPIARALSRVFSSLAELAEDGIECVWFLEPKGTGRW